MSSKIVKVPVVMHMEALECGAASLAMVMAYYKKWVSARTTARRLRVSRDGSKAKNVLRAARSYGFEAAGYSLSVEDLRENAVFPCIIHWNFNHFVVLCGFSRKYAYINDPAKGNVRVSMEEFDKSFTGICLQFVPTEAFQPSGKQRSVLEFAKSRIKGALVPIIFVSLTGFLIAMIGIITQVFQKVFLDRILSRNDPEWLYPFLLLMAGIVVIQIIVEIINEVYLLKIQGKLAIYANSTFLWHVLRLPMEFFSHCQMSRNGSFPEATV